MLEDLMALSSLSDETWRAMWFITLSVGREGHLGERPSAPQCDPCRARGSWDQESLPA